MAMTQKLPANGEAREALRGKGQFWTPAWLAKVMANWVTALGPKILFDPAVGPGTFFAAARECGFAGEFHGCELHPESFEEGWKLGLKPQDFRHVQTVDFIGAASSKKYSAIISNPPYIRHHRLADTRKQELKRLAQSELGFALDGRVGLHVFFLIKSLAQLAPGGRLAFLLPADVCEGVSASALWHRICGQYRLVSALSFAEEAAPFPQVDTNAMVFLFSNERPQEQILWLRVLEKDTSGITAALAGARVQSAAKAHRRELAEALATGLSRPPRVNDQRGVPLACFAKVVRGIATGGNEFFFLTREQLRAQHLPEKFFRRAIGRTRDCPADRLTPADLERLETSGRATWLLNLDGESSDQYPPTLQTYLGHGVKLGLPDRSLIQSRRPWYKMEKRTPPPILFAYLGRRDCRFILNESGAVPLTGFLCVYPWNTNPVAIKKLWTALNHPDTLVNLAMVAKSYGGGALKAEPRQLDQLEIPEAVLHQVGLIPFQEMQQMELLEEKCQQKSPSPSRKHKTSARRPVGSKGSTQS
jgi:hypothetical protein